ncbi:hypothetical protein FQZ97_850430 [compost metagenome]
MGGAHRVAVGNPRVRQVVAFQVVVVQVHAGVGAQAEGQRRRHAPTVVVDLVAAGDVALVAHQVEAERAAVEELPVDIGSVALGLVGAPGEAAVGEVVGAGTLAHQVDAAAGRTTTAEGRVRPLADLDGLDGEDLAGLGAGVTHAVQEGVALGIEAADEGTVALGVAALASAHGDTRHGAQGVLQGHGGGIADHLLRHHGYRARRIHQRRGHLRRRGAFHLVTGVIGLLAHHRGGIQGDDAVVLLLRLRRMQRRGDRHRADGHADGRDQQTLG